MLAQSDSPPPSPRRSTRVVATDDLPAPVSVQRSPGRSEQPRREGPDPQPNRERRVGSLTNYRIVLEVEPRGQPSQRLSLVMTEGSAELDTISPDAVKIDGNQVPSTVTLSVTLTELNPSHCELKLLFGRTVPFVSGAGGNSGGPMRSVVQQLRLGLETSLILRPGQSIVVQDTDQEQITLSLNRVE